MTQVPGLLAIIISDRDGVPIVRSSLPDCPEAATRPAFLSSYTGSVSEQAGKMGVGANTTLMAVYGTHQVVHMVHESLLVTLVAKSDTDTGHLTSLVDVMKPFLTDVSGAILNCDVK